jgi:hypothetical protein
VHDPSSPRTTNLFAAGLLALTLPCCAPLFIAWPEVLITCSRSVLPVFHQISRSPLHLIIMSSKDSYYYDSWGRLQRRTSPSQSNDPYSYGGSMAQGRRPTLPPLTSVVADSSPPGMLLPQLPPAGVIGRSHPSLSAATYPTYSTQPPGSYSDPSYGGQYESCTWR